MKNLSQHIDGLEPSRLVRKNGLLYDRQTLLHKNHILDGGVGYGVRILNYQQLSAIDSMLHEERFEFLCQPHDGTYAVSHASVESDSPGAC
jgi:hypothetical protein